MDVLVREATIADADQIAALTRAAWSGKVVPSSSGHSETEQEVAAQLREGGAFLLFMGDTAIGSVRWSPLDLEPDIWEIRRMGVLAPYRGTNLSQHLLEAIIHHAQTCSVTELRLAVRSDQPKLIDFYAAFAFELAEELDYSHANPAEPAPLVMRRLLHR